MAEVMGVPLKTENEEWSGEGHADKTQRRRAASFDRRLHARFSMATTPVAFRPPHPLPKAGNWAAASSFFSFEEDPHDPYSLPFPKA